MQVANPKAFRIESVFAGVYSGYWMSMCAFSGFMAVYLAYYGFSDGMIGVTASLISLVAIVYQVGVSSFLDARPQVALKKIVLLIYFIVLGLIALLSLAPMPVIIMLAVYGLTGGLANGLLGLFNAQVVQIINIGLPVKLSWPRAVSATVYALFSYFLGLMIERYAASILMPIAMVCVVFGIAAALMVPEPREIIDDEAIPLLAKHASRTSLKQMLSGSRVLQMFLLTAVFMAAGQSNISIFLARIVEARGGTGATLGLAMLIQTGFEVPSLLFTPQIMRRFRTPAILSLSLIAYFTKSLILLVTDSILGVMVSMALSLLCFGLFGVTSIYFINSIVRDNEKVRAQSLLNASGAFSAIIANLGAGWVVERFGITSLNLICTILQAVAAALMLYCAFLQYQNEHRPAGRQR